MSIKFKILFTIGITLLFISIFLDWYSIQIIDINSELIADWKYNLFSEWLNKVSISNVLGEWLRPSNLHVPIFVHWLFIAALIVCAFGVGFKDLETSSRIKSFLPFAYCNVFLLILNGFYSFVFPVMFLFSNNLYFPFLFYQNGALEVSIFYSVGIGYYLQIVGFVLIFPYSVFYYKTITGFETEDNSAHALVKNRLQQVQENLNLDKYIAEEEVKINLKNLDSQKRVVIRKKMKVEKR